MAIKYDAPNEAVKNCSWNPPEDESGRVCCGDGEAICSNCASVRDRWLARLIEEVIFPKIDLPSCPLHEPTA